jgi:hypothetical protein
MLPLRRVQLRKPQNAWPMDRSHCRGNYRAFPDLVAAEALCFLIFVSSAPIFRATNYDEWTQEATGNRRGMCTANLARYSPIMRRGCGWSAIRKLWFSKHTSPGFFSDCANMCRPHSATAADQLYSIRKPLRSQLTELRGIG